MCYAGRIKCQQACSSRTDGEMELGMHRNGKILGRNRKTNTLKQLAEAETEYRMWLLLFFIYFALIFQHCINQTIKCPL